MENVKENVENLVELEFGVEQEVADNYLKFKTDIIELIEYLKEQISNYRKHYATEVEPQLLALKELAEKHADDELLVKYATEKLENAGKNGFSREAYEEKLRKMENKLSNYERVYNEYFTETIVDGKAYPLEKTLNYCEIAKILTDNDE